MLDLDELVSRVDLATLVEKAGGQLHGRDGKWRGACPLHGGNDKSAFSIFRNNDGREYWRCWTDCNAGGNAIKFMMRWRGCDFIGAVKELAQMFGIPPEDIQLTPSEAAEHQKRHSVTDVLAFAAKHYQQALWGPDGKDARDYLHKRGFTDDTIKAAGYGYADGKLLKALREAKADWEAVKAAGLIRENGSGDSISSGYVVFVHEYHGQIEYLSARNIYTKRHYNLPGEKQLYWATWNEDAAGPLWIVEGQANADTLAQLGRNAMALCGHALNDRDIAIVQRFKGLVLALDWNESHTGQSLPTVANALGPMTRIAPQFPGTEGDANDWLQTGKATPEALAALELIAKTWVENRIERVAALAGDERDDAAREMMLLFSRLDDFGKIRLTGQAAQAAGMNKSEFAKALAATEKTSGNGGGKYIIRHGRICYVKPGYPDDAASPLCNFVAQISSEVARDDGEEVTREYIINGKLAGGSKLPDARIEADKFSSLKWIDGAWGSSAIIEAGSSTADNVRAAIKHLSKNVQMRHVYTHTGWREIDGRRAYISSIGAIGAPEVAVEFDSRRMRNYQLPPEPGQAKESIAASLRFLDCGPMRVTMPLLTSIYLAPLMPIVECNFMLWVYGVSGNLKSSTVALAMNHYGPWKKEDFISWASTPNSIEHSLFTVKDAVSVVDDFCPQANRTSAQAQENNAQRIVRAVANRAGRDRMLDQKRAGRVYQPRAFVISTGEMLPGTLSISARLLTVEIEMGEITTAGLDRGLAESHLYNHALSNYILWLDQHWGELERDLPIKWHEWRDHAREDGKHLRLPEATASMFCGWATLLRYALDMGVISQARHGELWEAGWEALMDASRRQAEFTETENPVDVFINTFNSLIASGAIRLNPYNTGSTEFFGGADGALVGWYDSQFYYLNPEMTYQEICEAQSRSGSMFSVKENTLRKMLSERGILDRQGDKHYTAVIRIESSFHRVLRTWRKKIEPQEPEK